MEQSLNTITTIVVKTFVDRIGKINLNLRRGKQIVMDKLIIVIGLMMVEDGFEQ